MFFAKDYPERISHLIVIDIAPKSYILPDEDLPQTINHMKIIAAMNAIDFSKIKSRQDVDNELAKTIPYERVRQFLLKNLNRNSSGNYEWRLNVKAIEKNMSNILDGMNEQDFKNGNEIVGFPVLFVKAANSAYILEEDYVNIILNIFPFAELVTIPNAGHWVHAEQTTLLLKNILYFIYE